MVATVDHGLRAESATEAQAVAALCAARGLPHATLPLGLSAGPAIQARARAARYAALAGWADREGLAAIATAHHADDQAETMAMRLHRGAGVRGLAGMRAVATVPGAPSLPLLRPLLDWRRAELAQVVAQAGLGALDDPSNRDPRFERVRVRQGLAAAGDWLDAAGLAASARHCADADAALDWCANRLFAQGWKAGDAGVEGDADGGTGDAQGAMLAVPADLPAALALRLLERVLARLGSRDSPPRGPELARWHQALATGGVATLGGVRGEGREAEGGKACWQFTRAAPHRCG